MDYADLLQQTQTAAALDRATAERVIWATVVTLAERMSHEELVRLSRRLPKELQAALRAGSPTCQPFGADEFVGRVAERVGSSRRRPGRTCGRCWARWSGRWPRWRRSGSGCRASSTRSWPEQLAVTLKLGVPAPHGHGHALEPTETWRRQVVD